MISRCSQVGQETRDQRRRGQLVNITNKLPTLSKTEQIVCTPPKALQFKDCAGFATENTSVEEGTRRLKGGKVFSLKSQSFESVPHDEDECPKLKAVQESSVYASKVSLSARVMLPPGDSDLSPPPVRHSVGD